MENEKTILITDKQQLSRKTDKYVVWARELSSRGTSFWIALLGVILQAAHTSLLLYGTSAFHVEWQKLAVSLGLGLFLSSSLMIFTLKHKVGDAKSEFTLNLFFWFEVFIGVFYYLNKLIFSVHKETGEWPDLDSYVFLIIGLPFAYMAPYAIKQFAYVIKSDVTLDYGSIDVIPDVDKSVEDIDESKAEELKTYVDEQLQDLQTKFKESSTTVDYSIVDEKINDLKASTKDVLKILDDKIEKNTLDASKFIKKGETIKMKTGDNVSTITIDE